MDSNWKFITSRFYVQYGFSNHSFYEKMGNKHLQLWWSEVYLFNKEINDCVEGPCFILHVSTVTSSFRLQLYLGFVYVFTKVTFVADIFFFLLRRTNCWSGDRESPARSLANVVRKRCAGVQDSVDSTVPLFRRPHIPCLEMSVHVFMCLSLAVMSQSNFSSVPTLPLGLEDERMGCIPII